MTTLFRANAYRLQRFDTPADQRQPEVHVFVEAADEAAAGALILRTLAALWGCSTADVEFFSLVDEAHLMGSSGAAAAGMGDAALLVTGWFHGPLFTKPEHTLSLVTPRTLERLHRARQLASAWQIKQREAARLAANPARGDAAQRNQLVRQMAAADGLMGAAC